MSNFFSDLENKTGSIHFEVTTDHTGSFDLTFTDTCAIVILFSNTNELIINGLKNTGGDFHAQRINNVEIQGGDVLGTIIDYQLGSGDVFYGVTGQQRVTFYGANTIRNSNRNVWHFTQCGYFNQGTGLQKWKITNNTGVPLVIPPTYATHSGVTIEIIGDNFYILPDNFSPYIGQFGRTMELESIFATNEYPTEKTAIYHDIYRDGASGPVYIHTHHNIKNGDVKTYIQKSVGGKNIPGYYTEPFNILGACQFDKGMIQDWTSYQSLYLEFCSSCTTHTTLTSFTDPHAWVRFKDTITNESGISEKTTDFGLIAKDGSNKLYEMPNSAPDVFIRFFDGKPSEEAQHNSDSGEYSDEYNYDKTKKGSSTDYSKPSDVRKGSDEGSVGKFHDAYLVDDLSLTALRQGLWTQNYYNVLKVNSNPIDNIVSCKRLPFEMTSGNSEEIKIGNISTGINGNKIEKGVYSKVLGIKQIVGRYGNFLDFDYTNLAIYLPFIGVVPLDTKVFMGATIKVEYLVDIVTGSCKAIIYKYCLTEDGTSEYFPMIEREGTMGIDCTLSASTQKQSEIANYFRLANGVTSIATGVASGNVASVLSGVEGIANNTINNNYSSTSTNAPISSAGYIDAFIIYDYPEPSTTTGIYPNGYLSSIGAPCEKTTQIGKLSGFFKCSGDVKLSRPSKNENIMSMTREEEMEIKEFLSSGVIL